MEVAQIILITVSCLLVVGTLLPLVPSNHWMVRGWEFPRLQLASLLLVVCVASIMAFPFVEVWHYILNFSLLGCLFYQAVKVVPYTPFYFNEVNKSNKTIDGRSISLLASNVYMPNRNVDALVKLIEQKKPNIIVTLETNYWWEQQLDQLKDKYQYCVKVPLENMYGMHLYANLPLEDIQVKFLIDNEIPSIHGKVVLSSGERVELHCLHPMPPSPTESETSTDRDAELLMVGKEIDTDKGPVIVLGDLNDVAWSDTTNLFQKISGLLDPRKGRGSFNTFHAKYPFMRWPLDHIFHSNHFTLNHIERLPSIGSDHFPIYISLHLEPYERHEQEEPEADGDDEALASEKVADGMV